jgi:hypothetical protein
MAIPQNTQARGEQQWDMLTIPLRKTSDDIIL